jgi:uncharacterized membrane protein
MFRSIAFVLLLLTACSDEPDDRDAGVITCPNDLPASCPAAPPSYAGDIRPIVDVRCSPCHFPGGAAQDKLFVTYDDVHARRRDMLNQIYNCRMPPSDAGQLSAEEREKMLAWFKCEAPNN